MTDERRLVSREERERRRELTVLLREASTADVEWLRRELPALPQPATEPGEPPLDATCPSCGFRFRYAESDTYRNHRCPQPATEPALRNVTGRTDLCPYCGHHLHGEGESCGWDDRMHPCKCLALPQPATEPACTCGPYAPCPLHDESQPATEPALDEIVDRCRQHIAGLGADLSTIKAREATSAQREAAADRAYAHLRGIDTILTDALPAQPSAEVEP